MSWLILPWVLQGLLILFDEFVLHRRREIPLWERIGHPLDTLTVLACLGALIGSEPAIESLRIYFVLAAFSCVFVTKDEFVHASRSSPLEHWIHSMLFVLHPICLGAAGWAWWQGALGWFLRLEAAGIVVFLGYQLGYLLFYRAEHKPLSRPLSGHPSSQNKPIQLLR